MKFADYIEQFKADMGLTNRDIARIMEVGPMTFDNYLSGYVPPSRAAMGRLLSILAPQSGDEGAALPTERLPFETVDVNDLSRRLTAEGSFAVPVNDDNMQKKRLYPGSIAIVRGCIRPGDGDILCLSIDGGDCCFRSFFEDGDGVHLSDDNGEMLLSREEFAVRVRILGRLTAVADKTDK